ncbi:MAG: hypothetical protein NVS3B25_24220 [Hymenobacter sp.]
MIYGSYYPNFTGIGGKHMSLLSIPRSPFLLPTVVRFCLTGFCCLYLLLLNACNQPHKGQAPAGPLTLKEAAEQLVDTLNHYAPTGNVDQDMALLLLGLGNGVAGQGRLACHSGLAPGLRSLTARQLARWPADSLFYRHVVRRLAAAPRRYAPNDIHAPFAQRREAAMLALMRGVATTGDVSGDYARQLEAQNASTLLLLEAEAYLGQDSVLQHEALLKQDILASETDSLTAWLTVHPDQ